MNAEIIAVGTELLMGQIVNTNAQFLSQQFAGMGVNVYYQTVVGDNAQRMAQSFQLAASRADLVVVTGGLGPTQDDITKDVLARLIGRPLTIHQPSYDYIEDFFKQRNTTMIDSNARQALLIEGSDALPNSTGMAVGLAITWETTNFILLPGPPKELIPMFLDYAVPWISARMNGEQPLFSKMLKFAGIGESSLEDKLKDLIIAQSDPTLAPYAKEGEVTIRVTTRAADRHAAEVQMAPVMREIVARVGDHLYAEEDIGIETAIVRLMSEKKLTLSAAESCTGGLLSEMITSVPGSSAMYAGGVICYSNDWKSRSLGVPMELLEGADAPGAVSEEAALALAEGVRIRTGTDFAVAITGVAGPAHSEKKPVGLVYIAIASAGSDTYVARLNLHGNRELIRLRAVKQTLYQLWKRVK